MFKIELHGLNALRENVDDLIKDRIPKMTAMALTETARKLKEATPAKLEEVFDRPTRWTLGGVFYQPASVGNLNAYVWFKDDLASGTGTPAAWYLNPEVYGGNRNLKRFEKALRAIGVLPDGWYTVPGSAAKMDAYGNMDRKQIIQILSYFRAFPEAGYKANITEKKKARLAKGSKRTGVRGFAYFVGRPGYTGHIRKGREMRAMSKLPFGIWQRVTFGAWGTAVKPILIFTQRVPQYKVRLPFYEWADQFVDKTLPVVFNRIAAETLAFHKGKG